MLGFLSFLSPKLARYVIFAGAASLVAIAIYSAGYSGGFAKAKKACDAANLEAQISAQKEQIKNLREQADNTQSALEDANSKKDFIIRQIAKNKEAILDEISSNPECTLDDNVVRMLNNTRSANPDNHK